MITYRERERKCTKGKKGRKKRAQVCYRIKKEEGWVVHHVYSQTFSPPLSRSSVQPHIQQYDTCYLYPTICGLPGPGAQALSPYPKPNDRASPSLRLLALPYGCGWVVRNHISAPSNSLYLSDRVPEWVGGKNTEYLLMRKPMSKNMSSRSRRAVTYVGSHSLPCSRAAYRSALCPYLISLLCCSALSSHLAAMLCRAAPPSTPIFMPPLPLLLLQCHRCAGQPSPQSSRVIKN